MAVLHQPGVRPPGCPDSRHFLHSNAAHERSRCPRTRGILSMTCPATTPRSHTPAGGSAGTPARSKPACPRGAAPSCSYAPVGMSADVVVMTGPPKCMMFSTTLGPAAFALSFVRVRSHQATGGTLPGDRLAWQVLPVAPDQGCTVVRPTPSAQLSAGARWQPRLRHGGAHPYHLGQPPQVVMGLSCNEGGFQGRCAGTGPVAARRQSGEQTSTPPSPRNPQYA